MENPFSSLSSSAQAQRQLCIQNEPKALFEKEMKLAREAALEVINNNSRDEALKIFLKGLEPVMTSVKPTWETSDSDDEEY